MSIAIGHSLRARLLWFLLAAIAVAAAVQALVTYRTALTEADQIFDYHMQQMALSLRPGLPLAGPTGTSDGRDGEENFDFVVQVWAGDGVKVFESTARSALPQRAVLGFSDVEANGTTYRVFSVQTRSQVIQVAQDLAVRREMARTLALRAVGPILLMVPILMLAVWWVVSHSLAPVSRVRRQIAERQADDLSPVGDAGLPDEVRPLVQELNLLFGRVRNAFDAQKHFVADAAHELRSPLAALKLQVQGLQRADSEAAREMAMTRLTAGIDRASRLVQQLLVLARQEASVAAGAKPASTALLDVARLAVADVIAAAQAREIDVGITTDENIRIDGHADSLRILIHNLLDNAVKYAPAGGRVDLSIVATAEGAELSVEDDGPGIPAEERERVLDRFYRVGGTEAPGSGLGLAIVKAIADLHDARVILTESQRLGGLRVVVVFPRSPGAQA
jgi:two-component system OmpR family sensor kinase